MRFGKGDAWGLMAVKVIEYRAMDSFALRWFARRRKGKFSSAFVVESISTRKKIREGETDIVYEGEIHSLV